MTLLFIGIVIGIVVGLVGSLVVSILPFEKAPPDCDLADLITDIEPVETPLTKSVIEEHRQAHLKAMDYMARRD